jgi:hypothetical protein
MRHPGYSRNFESALAELAGRGHDVHVALDSNKVSWLGGFNPLDPLSDRYPNLTYGPAPSFANRDGWTSLARELRTSLDYLRYLEPEYRNATKLRARAEEKARPGVRSLPGTGLRPIRAIVAGTLRRAERSMPIEQEIEGFVSEQKPDVVLVTPLVAMGSSQVDYVRAARKQRIPTALPVTSWDNLTNKGLIHEAPDRVLVWNDAQRREAMQLHGLPSKRIAVTGAQCYDHWFSYQPSETREEFSTRLGLRADRPIVLYLCSSTFIAPVEVPFVRRWVTTIRSGPPGIADVGILVRPHPQNFDQWRDVDLGPQTAVWPRGGADPVDHQAKQGFFNSMYHCATVVGVNTTAQIESAIVGRTIHTVLADEFRETQDGTLHFAHIGGESGMLRVTDTLDEHVEQLGEAITANGADTRTRAFVESFIRPRGLDRPATPIFADEIERLAEEPASRLRQPLTAPLYRAVLRSKAKRLARKPSESKTERTHVKQPKPERPAKAAKPGKAEKREKGEKGEKQAKTPKVGGKKDLKATSL